jgi:tetratricopeptide (TPR) repeat protein
MKVITRGESKMPFSSNSGKGLIDRAVQRFSEQYPKSQMRVLDIGVGSGTYFDRYSNTLLPKSRAEWTGVEIWQPYIEKYSLRTKYDRIYEEDARKFANFRLEPMFDGTVNKYLYDICFVGDIAEHMTKEEAQKMISDLSERSRVLIMSIPIGHYPQEEFEGNPYEKHITDNWSVEEVLNTFNNIFEYGVENEIGVFFISKNYKTESTDLLRPKIAVYGICKDEEQFAKRFTESIKDADYISICDTGSTDNTVEIVKQYATHAKLYTTTVSPWRFDDARNNALMLLPADVDLCISLDFDEYLHQPDWYTILSNEIRNNLRTRGRLYDKYNCRFQTIWDWKSLSEGEESKNCSSHWHERIHTRHNWKWKLPVHEILVFTGSHPETWAWLGGFWMTQKPETKEGRGSYLPLLEQSLKEDPKIWKSWFFYADELMKQGKREEAISALTKALATPNSDASYLHLALGDYYLPIDILEASNHYQKACQLNPTSRERWVKYAQFNMDRGQLEPAQIAIEKAKACTVPSSGYDHSAWCWGPEFDKLYEEITGKTIARIE